MNSAKAFGRATGAFPAPHWTAGTAPFEPVRDMLDRADAPARPRDPAPGADPALRTAAPPTPAPAAPPLSDRELALRLEPGLRQVQHQLHRLGAELAAWRRSFGHELRALRRTLLFGMVLQAASLAMLAAALVYVLGPAA